MLHSRRLLMLLAFCLMILSLSQIVAQDETPTLTPLPTEIIIPTLPPTETPTDLPSATPLPSFTPTILPSETPTLVPTETPTLTAVETATEIPVLLTSESSTPTLTVDASLSPTITLTPSATQSGLDLQAAPGTQVVATPSDPNDQPFNVSDNFDDATLSNWAGDVRDRRISKGGSQQLALSSSQIPVFLNQGYLKELSLQLDLNVSKGIVWLTTYSSEAGNYSVAFDANGSVTLYRAQQLIGIAIMPPFAENEMRTVNLQVVGGLITITVAGKEIIRAVDPNPLPAGVISMRGGEGSFDGFSLSAKIDTLKANTKSTKPIDSAQISKSSIQALAVTSPRIVFDSYDNGTGDSDIFMVNSNGTGLMNLTLNAGYDQMPAWSPDGTQIAFISSRNGGAQIYIMDVATRSVTQLTTGTGSKDTPSWSQDGQWISYGQPSINSPAIYKINIAPNGPTSLIEANGIQANWSWGHTDRLVFVGIGALYIDNGSGTNATFLGAYGVEPNYSADGSKIAYRYSVGPNPADQRIGVIGSQSGTIYNSSAYSPNWSPDGNQLVISKGSNNQPDDLFIINTSGGIINQVTSGNRVDNHPDWSNGVATSPTLTPIPTLTPTTSSYTCPCSLWTTGNTPAVSDSGNLAAVEVGVKFKSSVSGYVTGMGFYKDVNNTGTHTGHLWTSTGTLLATVTFSGESASGWQTATFSNPVALSANTIYIISYHTPSGRFSYTLNYLTSAWTNGPLTALDNTSSGGNGVYGIGTSGTFPTSNGGGANFWVDVIFTLNSSPTSTPTRTPTITLTPTRTPTPTATSSGSSFPATGILDNFNRANGVIGGNWSGTMGDFSINNNQLDVGTTTSSIGSGIQWINTSFGFDQEAYVSLSTIDPAAQEIGLYLKVHANTALKVWYQSSMNRVFVSTYNNGLWSPSSPISVTFSAGDRFGARAKSNGDVEVYKNSTFLGNVNVPTFSNVGGYIGVNAVNASATLLDDFGGGDPYSCPTGFAAQASALGPGDNPCVQVTPTPTWTPSPFPTSETGNITYWHVACTKSFVNVRNYPSGQVAPVIQIDGKVIMTVPSGTVLAVIETRKAQDGVIWVRISGYEAYNGRDTLWIRTKDQDGTDSVKQGLPNTEAECTTLTPPAPSLNINVTPIPTTAGSFPISAPGCATPTIPSQPPDCPLTTPPAQPYSDVDQVAFVLACEAGNDRTIQSQKDALGIAYVVRNRMNSGLYQGTAAQVIKQSTQFQCWGEGARWGNNLGSISNIDPVIRGYANSLVNNLALPTPFDMGIRWYGLYTYGVQNASPTPRDPVSRQTQLDLLSLSCSSSILNDLLIGIAEYGDRIYATAFLSAPGSCS